MSEDTVLLVGRTRERAQEALAAARAVGLPTSVVRTTSNGYLVPEEVASYIEGTWVAQPEQQPAEVSLADLRKAELIELATYHGVDTDGTKAILIERIERATENKE